MDILACKLAYSISSKKKLDVFIASYELIKCDNQYYWSCIDRHWFYFNKTVTSNSLHELKVLCLKRIPWINDSTFLLESFKATSIFNFSERDLDNQIYDIDLNSYVNSFTQEIERATSGVSSHSC